MKEEDHASSRYANEEDEDDEGDCRATLKM